MIPDEHQMAQAQGAQRRPIAALVALLLVSGCTVADLDRLTRPRIRT
jgi:hypothetical protein